MKNFCLDLRDHATKIMSYEKNEMIPLTNEERKIHRRQKNITYAKKDLVQMMTIKSMIKSEIIVTTQGNIEKLPMIFVI